MVRKKYIHLTITLVLLITAFSVANYLGRSRDGNAEINPVDGQEISGEFNTKFFEEYYDLRNNLENDPENFLLVASAVEPNDYGAVKTIKAPDDVYYMYYDTASERDTAFEQLKQDDTIDIVEKNTMSYYLTDFESWGVEEMGLDHAMESIGTMDSPNNVKVAVVDTGLNRELFGSYFPDRNVELYCVTNCEESEDSVGHGTAVTSALADSTLGNVDIIAIKADTTYSGVNGLTLTDILTALYYAGEQGANVINASWVTIESDPDESLLKKACDSLMEQGVIIVAASGNYGSETIEGYGTNPVLYPAAFSSTMSIGALNKYLTIASFSTHNEYVDFAGPGVNVQALDIKTGGLKAVNGTSIAAPFISAAVANILSVNKNLGFSDMINVLKTKAIDLGAPGKDDYYGWGFVDLSEASFCTLGKRCDSYGVFVKDDFIENKTNGVASYVTDGEAIYVTSDEPCILLETVDEGLTFSRINAESTGKQNKYKFKFSDVENVKVYIILAGDVDLNGVVDSNDALKIAGYVVNDSLLSDMQEKVADVNKNGIINSTDALKIAREYSDMETIGWSSVTEYSISNGAVRTGEDSDVTISISSSQASKYYGMTIYFPKTEENGAGFTLDELTFANGISPFECNTETGVVYWADLNLDGVDVAKDVPIVSAKYKMNTGLSIGTYTIPVRVSAINASSDVENFTLTATVQVLKKEDKIVSPEPPEMLANLKIVKGSKLSELGGRTLGFSWVNENETVEVGQNTYRATYTYNNDTSHYTTINVDVPVYGLNLINISVQVEGSGGYNADSLEGVLEGSDVEIKFNPTEGSSILKVLMDGVDVTNTLVDNTLHFVAGKNNVSIKVVYSAIQYTFKIVGNNVITNPKGVFKVAKGADQSVSIEAEHGYVLTSVLVNKVEKIKEVVDNKITIKNIEEDTTLVATAERIVYKVIKGDGQTVSDDATKITFKIDADVTLFKPSGEVYIDDVLVGEEYYTVSGTDNTSIKIKASYLDNLDAGVHTLNVIFSDGGIATATFTIEGLSVPNTGDSAIEAEGSSVNMTLLPLLVGCLVVGYVVFKRNRHKVVFIKYK